MSFHKDLNGADIHTPITYVYATETDRQNATGFVAGDVGKFAYVQDTKVSYQLVGFSPIEWTTIGASIIPISWLDKAKNFFDPTSGLPSTPTEGDRWIASATANGWTENYIYTRVDSSWTEFIPTDGDAIILFEPDPNEAYIYSGSMWASFGSVTQHNELLGIQGGTSGDYQHLTTSQLTDIGLNTTHRTSNGSDHTFLDQDVTTTSSPTFEGVDITPVVTKAWLEGRTFYDDSSKAFSYYSEVSSLPAFRLGRVLRSRVRNETGDTLLKGTVVKIVGLSGTSPIVDKASNDNISDVRGTIGIIMHDLLNNSDGYVGVFDTLIGIDTSTASVNDLVYLDKDGTFTFEEPKAPDYKLPFGFVSVVDTVNGVIGVRFGGFTGDDTSVNIEGTLNGVVTQKPKVSFFNNGGIVYAEITNESNPTRDLPFVIDGVRYNLNTTSNIGPNNGAYIAIPEGTATTLQGSIIYIDPNGGNPIIGVRTTPIAPNEGLAPICGQSIFSYARTISDLSVFSFRRYNDAPNSDIGEGFNRYIADAIRIKLGTNWESGIDGTITINNVPVPGSLKLSTTGGIARQLHYQTFNAQDGNNYWVYNDNTNQLSYEEITDLNQITEDANGNSMEANGTYYRLKVYGMQNSNSTGGDNGTIDRLIVTRPLGQYSTEAEALVDANNFDVFASDINIGEIIFELYTIVVYRTGPNGENFVLIELQDNKTRIKGVGGGGASGGSSTDDKVRITANDITNNYLDPKIVVGSNKLSKTINNSGGNEELSLDIIESNIIHQNLNGSGTNTHTDIDNHITDSSIHYPQNAISITASQVNDLKTIDGNSLGGSGNLQILTNSTGVISDWDPITTPGVYRGSNTINGPPGFNKFETVFVYSTENGTVIVQTAVNGAANGIATRRSIDSGVTWGSWFELTLRTEFNNHTNDNTIHFTEGSIDHTAIQNIGTNTHAQIDSHISDSSIHYTEGSINHNNILNIGVNTHVQIDAHLANNAIHFTESSISHNNIQDIGTNSHIQIDSHIANITNPHSVTLDQVTTAGSITSNNITVGSINSGTILPNISDTYDIGANGNEYNIVYSNQVIATTLSGQNHTVSATGNVTWDGTTNISIINIGTYLQVSGSNAIRYQNQPTLSNDLEIPTKKYVDDNTSVNRMIINFGDLDFYTANDPMSYSTQGSGTSFLTKFVAMRACEITAISWQMGAFAAGRHRYRINGGTITNLQPSNTTSATGNYTLATPVSLNAGDELEIFYNASHADSHTVSVELTEQ